MQTDKIITSHSNPHIKNILKLREKKERGKAGTILIEGAREILRAKESGVVFSELYFCPEFCNGQGARALIKEIKSKSKGAKLFEVTEKIFSRISFGERKEGILAICQRPRRSFGDIKFKKEPFLIVVERVEKPGNLGALLRSCDGAGVDGIIFCENQTDTYNPNVVRSSLGTIFSVCVVESSNEEALLFLRKNKIRIFAATPNTKILYTQADFNSALACVVGSEEAGLSDFWLKNSDTQIKIPMQGKADSLNVSATTAILLYEALRQRGGQGI